MEEEAGGGGRRREGIGYAAGDGTRKDIYKKRTNFFNPFSSSFSFSFLFSASASFSSSSLFKSTLVNGADAIELRDGDPLPPVDKERPQEGDLCHWSSPQLETDLK